MNGYHRRKYFGSVAVVCVFLLGCQEQKKKEKTTDTIPVKVAVIRPQQFDASIEYIGNVKAQDEVWVYPKVSGKVLKKVRQEGDTVSKGETLLLIDRDEVGLRFEPAPVESPLSGVVGQVVVDTGSQVASQTRVALIMAMDTVKVEVQIPEQYLPSISLGQMATVEVDAYPQEKFPGAISKITPVVDLITRSAPIEITVDNKEHRLKSGMFARVDIILSRRENVPVVLKEAIMGRSPDQYVYIVENNKAQLRKVTLGIRQGPYYEIDKGLNPGEKVVIIGQQRLYEGAPVSVEE